MSDKVFGLSETGIARTAETNRRVLQTLPDTGRRTRRVYPQGGNGNQVEIVNFRVLAACPGLDASIGNRCPCVQAIVTRVLCVSSVQKGDLITVWDIDSCWFNIPLDLLIDRKGTAFLMLVGDDDNGQVNCSGYGAIRPGECFWSVESLCCAEESYSS